MKSFYTADSVTGAGKTHAATDIAAEKALYGVNAVIVMPTKRLIRQAIRKLKDRLQQSHHPLIAQRIKMIVSDKGCDEKVSARIHELLKTVGKDDGRILFVTHEAFQRVRHWHNRAHWHVIVDEVMEAVYTEKFTLKRHRHVLLGLIATEWHSGKYSRVIGLEQSRIEEWAANNDDDMVTALFSSLASRLHQLSNWSVFVQTEQFARFVSGEGPQLEVHGRLSPAIFDGFATVTLMAANLRESLTYRSFESYGCTFKPHQAIMSRLRYREHENGHRLKIYYLTDRVWSKGLRYAKVDVAGEPITMFDLLKQQVEHHFTDGKYLWIANKDIDDDEFGGTRLPNIPHGLDHYQDFNQCLIVSALNPSKAHGKFLADQAGIDERQFRRSVLSQVAYQALGRGGLRRPNGTEDFTLIVADRDTAEDVASMYPGCVVERLTDLDPAPKIKGTGRDVGGGRPKIHATQAARQAAYLARKKAQDCLNNLCDETDLIDIESSVTTGGFCFTPFRSDQDPKGGPVTYSMNVAQFYDLLCQKANNRFSFKKANGLFAPTIFSHGRKGEDALAHRGLILDLDHTKISVAKIAEIFPELSYISYSTANHSPEDWKYRLCFPTTAYVTPENAILLREMLIERFVQAGFTAAEHGVDHGKINPSALFYWPMQTPHGFVHLVDGACRAALDPVEWLKNAPVVEPPADGPPPPSWNSPQKERRKAGAVSAFLAKGTAKGKGHPQLYGLGMTLGLIGCDAFEIHETLMEMAVHTTNPVERRLEIQSIVKAATAMP